MFLQWKNIWNGGTDLFLASSTDCCRISGKAQNWKLWIYIFPCQLWNNDRWGWQYGEEAYGRKEDELKTNEELVKNIKNSLETEKDIKYVVENAKLTKATAKKSEKTTKTAKADKEEKTTKTKTAKAEKVEKEEKAEKKTTTKKSTK